MKIVMIVTYLLRKFRRTFTLWRDFLFRWFAFISAESDFVLPMIQK